MPDQTSKQGITAHTQKEVSDINKFRINLIENSILRMYKTGKGQHSIFLSEEYTQHSISASPRFFSKKLAVPADERFDGVGGKQSG
jgi:hypothetical protein